MPGDAIGFSVPPFVKLIIFLAIIFATIRINNIFLRMFIMLFSFIVGIHVSFNQLGNLSGELLSVLPLFVKMDICIDEYDSALKLINDMTIDTRTLAHFQRSVTCEGKTGGLFSYGYLWYETGPV